MEFFVTALIIYVLYLIIRKSKSSNSGKISQNGKVNNGVNIMKSTEKITSKAEIKQSNKILSTAIWYSKNDGVQVNQFFIPHGFIYVGEKLKIPKNSYTYWDNENNNDASLINPNLKVILAEPWEYGDEMGYWPKYSDIPAKCRGAYLKWLAEGRVEVKANIGYVFLFFYGLERRIFVDAVENNVQPQERLDIVNEVIRLLELYGDNNSFKTYAQNFLSMEWLLFQRDDDKIPEYLKFNGQYPNDILRFLLGKFSDKQVAIPHDIALDWVIQHPSLGIRLRTPARRCPNEFRELFKLKYTNKFGEGIIVKPNKTLLEINYHSASSTIGSILLSKEILNLPDPFILTAPVKKLVNLIEECTKELEPFSKYIGKEGNDLGSLYCQSLLPKELMHQASNVKKLKNLLANKFNDNDFVILKVSELYDLLDEKVPLVIDKKEAEKLAILIETLEFGIAPDNRYHHLKPIHNGDIVLFKNGHGEKFSLSKEFLMVCSILRLGAIISQIDGHVSQGEEELLFKMINENGILTNIEKDSLKAFLHWALITPQDVSGLKKKLENADQSEKTAIGHILISIAYADGKIDTEEIKQLEKIYTLLGLNKTQVVNDLHHLSVANEPVIVDYKDQDTSYLIPIPNNNVGNSTFALNHEMIKIREAETSQIKGVLGEIFTNDEYEENNGMDSSIEIIKEHSPVNELDEKHQNLFNTLITRESWERLEINEITKKLGLMTDGAFEVLNEWSYENVNAPLIEEGDEIFIDIEVAKEIINEQ